MMNLAMAFERTDEVVLPAVYSFVAASFGANLLQLSYLTLARALTQALLSPLGGWLGHAFNRVAVLSVGCLVWGAAMGAFCVPQSSAAAITTSTLGSAATWSKASGPQRTWVREPWAVKASTKLCALLPSINTA